MAGAVYATVPDVDMVVSFGGSWASLQWHRSVTHSLLFVVATAPILGWLGARIHRRWPPGRAREASLEGVHESSWVQWGLLAFFAMLSHVLLDAFTSYGTQLLWPFSIERVAWDGVAIVDPLFTFPLLVAVGTALSRRRAETTVRVASATALLICAGYLFGGLALRAEATAHVRDALQDPSAVRSDTVEVQRIRALPTLGNLLLWRVLVDEGGGTIGVTHVSLLTRQVHGYTRWESVTGPEVDAARARPESEIAGWFLDGWGVWTSEPSGAETRRVRWHDLRYGHPLEADSSLWGAEYIVDTERGLATSAEWTRWGVSVFGPSSFAAHWRLLVSPASHDP